MNAKINTRKIKARRVELDIKQKQMSEMLKCSTVTYSKNCRFWRQGITYGFSGIKDTNGGTIYFTQYLTQTLIFYQAQTYFNWYLIKFPKKTLY